MSAKKPTVAAATATATPAGAAPHAGNVPAKTSSGTTKPAPAKGASTTPASSSEENRGGFKATLTVFDMVIYGLIMMVPIAPMAIYGGVFESSGGMPALAYLIGFVAVVFSVLSFGIMIRRFPSSGSIYTYASNILGKPVGFITGWLMLLQYLVTPAVMYLIAGTALNGLFPQIPVIAWCLIFLVLVGAVALRGMQTTVVVNRIALVAELLILGAFFVLAVMYITGHPLPGSDYTNALFDPAKFNFGGTMNAVSLAVLSYVGFGCIATLTQEAKDERRGPSRAMMIMAIVLVVLFVAQCLLATLVDPTGASFKGNSGNAFYIIAKTVGGPVFSIICAAAVALSQGIFTALVTQTSVSVILYSMAKGGSLPKWFTVMKKDNLPRNANLFVLALSLVLIFVLLPVGVNDSAKIANFGALATYTILNICVIVYCWFQAKERKNPFTHLIFPAIGALVCFGIFISLSSFSLIIGAIWTAVGIAYFCVVKYGLHRDITLG